MNTYFDLDMLTDGHTCKSNPPTLAKNPRVCMNDSALCFGTKYCQKSYPSDRRIEKGVAIPQVPLQDIILSFSHPPSLLPSCKPPPCSGVWDGGCDGEGHIKVYK